MVLGSRNATLSTDGRYVAFESDAQNLEGSACSTGTPVRQIFVRDRCCSGPSTRRARRCTSGRTQDAAAAPPADPTAKAPTVAQRQADALALVAETALHQGLDPGPPGERYQVVVHVDAPVLADPEAPGQSVLEDGAHVPAGTSQRLACDASRVVMERDADGRVFEVGPRSPTRTARDGFAACPLTSTLRPSQAACARLRPL